MVFAPVARELDITAHDPGSVHTAPALPNVELDTDAVREWLHAFAQQSLDYAILFVGEDKRVAWANHGAAWILAATTAEIVGSPVSRFFTAEDLALGIPEHELRSALRQGSSDDDRWMLRLDGSRYWASGRTIALARRDGTPLGYFKIFRDQTETKMRMSTLRNRAALLEADLIAKTHSIAALTRELWEQLDAFGEAAANAPTARPTGDIAAAKRLVADLQRLMQADDPGHALKIESLLMDEELEAAIALADRRARGRSRVQLLLPPGQGIRFEGDRTRIRQALAVLVENAMRFTTDDEGRIWINASVEADQAVIRVEDNGAGFDADTQAEVFAVLTDAELPPEPARLEKGLHLARFLVALHGGSVQARSAGVGKGSEFSVRVPLRQSTPTMPAAL